MSRRLRYAVAVSLDGYIARLDGSFDWIVMDPAIDFAAMAAEYDTAVMGRGTWDVVVSMNGETGLGDLDVVVFSRRLPPSVEGRVRITRDDPRDVVRALKAGAGRDVWLYGGGDLFRQLLEAGLVDSVEVAVIPVLLGEGIPLLPPGVETTLTLTDHRVLPQSGIVALAYALPGAVGPAPTIGYVKPAPQG
ncbi:MAG: dihydrofolate reductase family protein [Vicinamibacterales bacterium]